MKASAPKPPPPLSFATVATAAAALVLGALPPPASAAGPLELDPGDHIAIIGNTLADRMQHQGWLEAMIHAAHPDHRLIVRNLGYSGDEVVTRLRSQNFGGPDEWLRRVEADVIFAFFGFNESFAGEDGLSSFTSDLDRFVKDSLKQRYNGESPPELVLFSPIAHEDLENPDLPDGAANNARLRAYADAVRRVALSNDVAFVDAFALSSNRYAVSAQPLTFNGIHLTGNGYRQLAPGFFRELFGRPAPAVDDPRVARVREAVVAKNAQWFQRYRTVDGYNVYGGRSRLTFDGITNFKVMQEEMVQRDVLTANHDRLVWSAAAAADPDRAPAVAPEELPPVTPVKTNRRGKNPDGTHTFLGGEEALAKMKVPAGCEVNLFASEEQFPQLVNPVQIAFDTRGRLWAAAWPTYPERTPDDPVGDSLLVFEDEDQDGRADSVTTFLGDLNSPTGFQFYQDGVLVMQSPDLWFVKDTDGDGKADWKERVLSGIDSADTHHTTNAMVLDPGGATYLSDGVFHRTQVETPYGPVRNTDGAIYRYEPRTHKFERYVAYGFANPHGKVFDHWGTDIITDATGNANYFAPAFSGFLDYPHKHPGMKQFWSRPSRPCPATGILYSRHFPDEYQGNFLNLNVISFLGIFRAKITEDGSGLAGATVEHLLQSSDPNCRPIDIKMGPEGAVYFSDWHNPIIGHMQHHIRDPNRDHKHGRIYRITYGSRPLLPGAKIHGQPLAHLLELLKRPELETRDRAKIEISKHPAAEVAAAVDAWVAALDEAGEEAAADDLEGGLTHHLLEALWVKQYVNVVDEKLLRRLLAADHHRARAAATRVLCYWRDRVPAALDLLAERAVDPHPRVRLEAVRAASFFPDARAADVALAALRHPTDYYLDYTLKETVRQLEPRWRRAIAEGEPIAADNPAGVDYLLRSVNHRAPQTPPHTDRAPGHPDPPRRPRGRPPGGVRDARG